MVEFRTKVCTNFSACINQHNRTDSKSVASFTYVYTYVRAYGRPLEPFTDGCPSCQSSESGMYLASNLPRNNEKNTRTCM